MWSTTWKSRIIKTMIRFGNITVYWTDRTRTKVCRLEHQCSKETPIQMRFWRISKVDLKVLDQRLQTVLYGNSQFLLDSVRSSRESVLELQRLSERFLHRIWYPMFKSRNSEYISLWYYCGTTLVWYRITCSIGWNVTANYCLNVESKFSWEKSLCLCSSVLL